MTNSELEEEIKEQQGCIDRNKAYIKALEKGVVTFDKPGWSGEGLESDIFSDLYDVVRADKDRMLQGDEFERFEEGEFSFSDLRSILERAGYSDTDTAADLVAELEKQNKGHEKRIYHLEQKKLKNKITEEVNIRICSLPGGDSAEKVMRYEKSIQKSISQNLAMLKKLQTLS